MDKQEIYSHVDHTLLSPTATYEEIRGVAIEAIEHKCACLCIPASYVSRVHKEFPKLNISGTVAFPLGYNTLDTKIAETRNALNDGANEIDFVINLGYVKDSRYDLVTEEIKALKEVCGNKILKVIIETCYLTDEEKIELCKCVTEAKADYIKTSTGFGSKGATLDDIKLFKKYIGPNVKMKAAGGIRTREDMESYLKEGCDRIGCSAAVKVLG